MRTVVLLFSLICCCVMAISDLDLLTLDSHDYICYRVFNKGRTRGLCRKEPDAKKKCGCSCNRKCVAERQQLGEQRIQKCCAARKVDSACMNVCHYKSSLATLISNRDCLPDLSEWVFCAADGQKIFDCCALRGVPTQCRPFCDGSLPPIPSSQESAMQYLKCGQKINDILACHLQNLPKAPTWLNTTLMKL